jgi:tetratricopeptide (TPR) repeat protein
MIKLMIQRHELSRIEKWIAQLIEHQRQTGTPEHVAKSLCNLATFAKDMGLVQLQYDLSRRAVEECRDDAWARAQLADALAEMGDFEHSLQEYEHAGTHGHLAISLTGKAFVLRKAGRLLESQAAYDDAIIRFPDNEMALTGRAQVLLELGRVDEALKAYDEVVETFPQNVKTRTGRAQVLLELGRVEESLKAYDEVVKTFPQNVVARNGRAQVLLRQGNFEEALVMVSEHNPMTHSQWVAFHMRGMIHLRMNELDKALEIFNLGVSDCPHPRDVAYFQTALAAAKIRKRQYKEALECLPTHAIGSFRRVINIFRLHAAGELEEESSVRSAIEALRDESYPPVVELRDELQNRYFTKPSIIPRYSDDWLFERETYLLLRAA